MATLVPSLVTGQNLYKGLQAWRAKDDASDNKANGSYSHVNIEFSATEANEWVGFFMYISSIVSAIQPGAKVTIKQIFKGGSITCAGAASLYNWQNFR